VPAQVATVSSLGAHVQPHVLVTDQEDLCAYLQALAVSSLPVSDHHEARKRRINEVSIP